MENPPLQPHARCQGCASGKGGTRKTDFRITDFHSGLSKELKDVKSSLTWRERAPLASLNLLWSNRELNGLEKDWGKDKPTGRRPGAEEGLKTSDILDLLSINNTL